MTRREAKIKALELLIALAMNEADASQEEGDDMVAEELLRSREFLITALGKVRRQQRLAAQKGGGE